MNHLNKVLVLVALYLVFMLAEACDGGIDCDCPPILPYFTVGSYELTSLDNELTEGDVMLLDLDLDDLEYVAQAAPCVPKTTWFSTSMYGCSCVGDGYMGLKDELIAIDMFSDKDFDAAHPAGYLLNDLVLSDQYGTQTLKELIQNGSIQYFINSYNTDNLRFKMEARPEELGTHNFTMEIHFQSGDFVSLEVPAITFS